MVLRTNSDSIPTQHSLIGFTTENECVYCAVGTKYLNPVRSTLFFKRLRTTSIISGAETTYQDQETVWKCSN